jgi:hypothetical protein
MPVEAEVVVAVSLQQMFVQGPCTDMRESRSQYASLTELRRQDARDL